MYIPNKTTKTHNYNEQTLNSIILLPEYPDGISCLWYVIWLNGALHVCLEHAVHDLPGCYAH